MMLSIGSKYANRPSEMKRRADGGETGRGLVGFCSGAGFDWRGRQDKEMARAFEKENSVRW